MTFSPGTRLGRYRVEHALGSGGMGSVLAVRRLDTGEPFAMKVLHESLVRNSEFRDRFLREAETARALTSEHVVRVYEIGVLQSGQPFIVMERLCGLDLESLLSRSEALPIAFVIDVALQACEALAEAHARGIVHRDLKPANLFLAQRDGGAAQIKLVDFGISRATWQPGLTQTGTALGSPPYMSPEQILSARHADARADIWSLGVSMYELLTGSLPFSERSIPALVAAVVGKAPVPLETLRPDVPPALASIVARCLQKHRDDRYVDVSELARDLRACRVPDSIDADEPTRVLARPARPDRLLWVAALTTLMVLFSLLLWIVELGWFSANVVPEDASSRGTSAEPSKPQRT